MAPQKSCMELADGYVSFGHPICRYVQLPINAGMTEAWEQRWQTVKTEDTVRQLSFMQAAARLGVGVFASAALQEGSLLQDSALEVIAPACWLGMMTCQQNVSGMPEPCSRIHYRRQARSLHRCSVLIALTM